MEIVSVEYATLTMINNLVASVSNRAKAKGLELLTDIDEKIPRTLRGDDVRLSQIIANLLTNAVKYTEKGSVTLTIHKKERQGSKVLLFISVKDTGIGIKDEDRERMFESFERLDETRNRNIEGTGLGMAIVTKLLAMMGSEIHLTSVYGKGSTFYFEIWQEVVDGTPLMRDLAKTPKAIKERGEETFLFAPTAKVLVTDDNEMNLKVISHLLKRCGIKPDLASSGMETIERIREKKYDIVFFGSHDAPHGRHGDSAKAEGRRVDGAFNDHCTYGECRSWREGKLSGSRLSRLSFQTHQRSIAGGDYGEVSSCGDL
jgi:CheY-like chemotaxis protein